MNVNLYENINRVKEIYYFLLSAFYTNEELFEEFLANFDYLLPEMLNLIYMPDAGVGWVKALKSYYLDNDLTGNASVVSDIDYIYQNYKR